MAAAGMDASFNQPLVGDHWAAHFSSLFEHMQEGVALHELVCDDEGRPIDYRVLTANPQYEAHTGLRREHIVGRLASEIYGTGAPPYLNEFASVGLGGPALKLEVYFPPLERHFSMCVAPLGARAFATIFVDSSAHKMQREALEQSRSVQRALLDNLPLWAWLKDTSGRYLAVNRAFVNGLGLVAADQLVGKTDAELFGAAVAESIEAEDAQVMRSGIRQFVAERVNLEDQQRWLEIYKSPLTSADGTVMGTTGLARDITDERELELARRESERKFETVFNLAPDAIAVTRTSGELVNFNEAFCRITGYSREELLGRGTIDLGLWKDPEIRKSTMERLASEGRVDKVELVLVSKDGTEHQMEYSGAMTTLDGASMFITAARDITDNKLAQAAADTARQELSQYFNTSLDLLCIACTDGTLLTINPAWQRVLGYPLADFQGAKFLDWVHPEDREHTVEATRALSRGETITDFRNRYRHADGSYRWLEWRSAAHKGRIFGVARDITERYAFEQALRNAERKAARAHEQLLSVAELAHIGHFAADFDTDDVTWTPEFFRILGLEPDSVTPSIALARSFVHPEDIDALDAILKAVRDDHLSARLHLRVVRRTGEIRRCLATLEYETADSGQDRMAGILQDLTDLKRAEDEQRRLEQQVMQTQKLESLGVLAGGIAHDFNNLLTSVLGNADLALRELPSASPACAYLEDIGQVSRRAADLCRQMLAYSGKGHFVVQPVSLNDIVREMASLLGVSISKKVVIKYSFSPEIPSVLADATQLRQVVMNLITNASEAIGEHSGVVTLTTGVTDCDEAYLSGVVGDADPHLPGRYVHLEVSDTGCGMGPETLSKIFDPFFTTKFTGRGLGLAAVMGIVRGHKGALRVYSEKGKGTTFKILLPAYDQPPQALERSEATAEKWRGHGLVLLADDEESIRSMARRLLEKVGFEVLTAADGREAIEVFQKHQQMIRFVILDMTMPHLDGEACFSEMRRISPQVKVIMTSGYSEQDVTSRFAGKGLAGFVQKPYKLTDLLPKLMDVTERE